MCPSSLVRLPVCACVHACNASSVVSMTSRVMSVKSRVVSVKSRVVSMTSRVVRTTPRVVSMPSRVVSMTSRVVSTTSRVVSTTSRVVSLTSRVVSMTSRVVGMTSLNLTIDISQEREVSTTGHSLMILLIIFILTVVCIVGGWVLYAYRNPTSPSGLFLIEKCRPWTWRSHT